MAVDIRKGHQPDLEGLLPLLGPAASKGASEAVLPGVVIVADSVVDFAVAIEAVTVVVVVLVAAEEEASDTKAEAALAEEVGIVEDMVMAQRLPPMLLPAQVEAEAVLAAVGTAVHLLVRLRLPMVLQGQTAVLRVGMALLVAHMTTDPLIVVAAAVEVGTAATAAQEASLAVTANQYDLEMEATGTAIDTVAVDETRTTAAERGITTAITMTTHAANGDTSRLAAPIGLLGGFSRFQHFFPFRDRVRKDNTFILDSVRLHHAAHW